MPKGIEHLGLDSRPSTKAFEGGLRGNDDQTLRRLIPPSAPSGFAFGDALVLWLGPRVGKSDEANRVDIRFLKTHSFTKCRVS